MECHHCHVCVFHCLHWYGLGVSCVCLCSLSHLVEVVVAVDLVEVVVVDLVEGVVVEGVGEIDPTLLRKAQV